MGKLGRLGVKPARRYERARPRELIHIDVKKLGQIEGGAGKRVRDRLRQRYNPRNTGAACVRRQRSAESTRTSRSTTALAWPTPRFSATRKRPPSSRPSPQINRRPQNPPPPYPLLPPTDQRQGRALHPRHAADRTYGVIYRKTGERSAALDGRSGTTTITENAQPSATSARSPAST
jgi:hypothetical protein